MLHTYIHFFKIFSRVYLAPLALKAQKVTRVFLAPKDYEDLKEAKVNAGQMDLVDPRVTG